MNVKKRLTKIVYSKPTFQWATITITSEKKNIFFHWFFANVVFYVLSENFAHYSFVDVVQQKATTAVDTRRINWSYEYSAQ